MGGECTVFKGSGTNRLIRLDRPVVVEGRYDKAKLAGLVDALILTTEGFRIYNDQKRLALLRTLAGESGLILLTDPDGAGFQIRNFLRGAVPGEKLINIYLPDLFGKERRKRHPSKEGKLGVEGFSAQQLIAAFYEAGVVVGADTPRPDPVSKTDLYLWGLSGTPEASVRRGKLKELLGLPQRLSSNELAALLSRLGQRQRVEQLLEQLG